MYKTIYEIWDEKPKMVVSNQWTVKEKNIPKWTIIKSTIIKQMLSLLFYLSCQIQRISAEPSDVIFTAEYAKPRLLTGEYEYVRVLW